MKKLPFSIILQVSILILMKEARLGVFFGILFSSSQISYSSFDTEALKQYSSLIWTSILVASKNYSYLVLVFYCYAYFIYFKTPHCSFVLECCEYLGPTLGTFAMIQKISIIKANNHLSSVWEVIGILFFILILLFTLFKVVYVNQPFPSEKEKRILGFSRKLRIFKIVKIFANCISFWVFGKTEFFIIFSLINVFDFMLTFAQINFIDTEI